MHRLPYRLRESICHRDNRRLLQTENILKVFREVLKEWLFGRARIAEHGRQSELSQQVVSSIVNSQMTAVLVVFTHNEGSSTSTAVGFSNWDERLAGILSPGLQRTWAR